MTESGEELSEDSQPQNPAADRLSRPRIGVWCGNLPMRVFPGVPLSQALSGALSILHRDADSKIIADTLDRSFYQRSFYFGNLPLDYTEI
jgi:hypothetical protein